MSAPVRPADAHARMSRMLQEVPTDEVGVYLLLCMTVLASHAPEVVLFIMDRADERLADADAELAGQ